MTPAGPRSQIGQVATPSVGGVNLPRRHVLDVETERLMNLCMRVGRRLRNWIRKMPEERAAMRFDRETGTHYPILDQDGKQVMEPLIPDRDWIENAEWYQRTLLSLLREQRERAKMTSGKGGPALDDATFEDELRELARQTIREMPESDLRALLAERTIEVEPTEPTGKAKDDDTI